MAQYDGAVSLALRLITRFGETSTILRRSDTVPDEDEPWNRTATETEYEVSAVWLDALTALRPGTVVPQGAQVVYVPASGLTVVPDAAIDQIMRADGSRWRIEEVKPLNPAGQPVMYELVVRQ